MDHTTETKKNLPESPPRGSLAEVLLRILQTGAFLTIERSSEDPLRQKRPWAYTEALHHLAILGWDIDFESLGPEGKDALFCIDEAYMALDLNDPVLLTVVEFGPGEFPRDFPETPWRAPWP